MSIFLSSKILDRYVSEFSNTLEKLPSTPTSTSYLQEVGIMRYVNVAYGYAAKEQKNLCANQIDKRTNRINGTSILQRCQQATTYTGTLPPTEFINRYKD
jgi:hypothetical protein